MAEKSILDLVKNVDKMNLSGANPPGGADPGPPYISHYLKKRRGRKILEDADRLMNSDAMAWDAMNAVIEGDDVDLAPDGEISAWFPEGEFMGMKIPEGTSDLVNSLFLIGAGGSGGAVRMGPTLAKKYIAPVLSKLNPKLQTEIVRKVKEHGMKSNKPGVTNPFEGTPGSLAMKNKWIIAQERNKAIRNFGEKVKTEYTKQGPFSAQKLPKFDPGLPATPMPGRPIGGRNPLKAIGRGAIPQLLEELQGLE